MQRMFDSAVIKLTIWYVGVLMLVSLTFSLPVFIITSDRLEQSAIRQMEMLREEADFLRGNGVPVGLLESRRAAQVELDRRQLLNNIILENLIILVIGTMASYWFARRTLRPIERSHEAQAKFTANASHQLRTPLATMQAEIDVALRDKQLTSKEARAVLQSNLEEIGRLRKLSDQLLMLTREDDTVETGDFDVVAALDDFFAGNKRQYRLSYKKTAIKNLQVAGESVLFGEVLRILCENASRYSGGKPVTLSLVKGRGAARVCVTDQGPGLRQEERERVFDRFYRGKDASRMHAGGHGLGLSLAQDIMQRYGGSIQVKSAPQKGSTFILVLPLS